MSKQTMPRAGGRYFRDKDGNLTRADKDGRNPAHTKSPAGKAAEAKPQGSGESTPAKNVKDRGHA